MKKDASYTIKESITVWLAYVAYPITTAVYFERALRQRCHTITVGPPLPSQYIEMWQLQNMNLPLKEQEISTGFQPDMVEVLKGLVPEEIPELYVWIESVGGHYPIHLEALPCPKVCYLIDCHLNLLNHLEWAKQFDIVFIAQREYLAEFRNKGMRAHWLPLGCDSEVHCSVETSKIFAVSFEGGIQPKSRRESLLVTLANQIPVNYDRCFWEDRAKLFSQSKIIFNSAVSHDLNMRNFEVMSAGSLVMTDMAKNSGQDELFRDGEDYAVYRDSNIIDVARFYLENEELREQIAARGQRLVHNAHTISHRVEDMLAVVFGRKEDTFSAQELRDRSLAGVPAIDDYISASICISSARRSFIIPVLDMSPASEYNILTLLKDLEEIEGDVIVVFNGQEVAEQLKDHPRITRYAIMMKNIGVARAWNLGLEIAATPTAFILNADLHVEPSAIDALEQALNSLPNAACVGPQGSFVEYALARDYVHFDKGTFRRSLEVDAVSGFFFAIKLEHFNQKILRFENGFTPCYFEEWDIGLQIKQAGLKNYIVPTSAYDHHWSGTIRALREINFYEKAETAGEILLRNRRIFLNKWRAIAERSNNRKLLESGFMDYVADQADLLIGEGRYNEAELFVSNAAVLAPENERATAMRRFCTVMAVKAKSSMRDNQGAFL